MDAGAARDGCHLFLTSRAVKPDAENGQGRPRGGRAGPLGPVGAVLGLSSCPHARHRFSSSIDDARFAIVRGTGRRRGRPAELIDCPAARRAPVISRLGRVLLPDRRRQAAERFERPGEGELQIGHLGVAVRRQLGHGPLRFFAGLRCRQVGRRANLFVLHLRWSVRILEVTRVPSGAVLGRLLDHVDRFPPASLSGEQTIHSALQPCGTRARLGRMAATTSPDPNEIQPEGWLPGRGLCRGSDGSAA